MSKIIFITLLVAVIFIPNVLTESNKKDNQSFPSFQQYVKLFKKNYGNAQFKQRQKIYNENLKYIQDSNCSSFGVNHFTDWSKNQMKQLKGSNQYQSVFGITQNQFNNSTIKNITGDSQQIHTSGLTLIDKVPTSFDWRQKNAITSIKLQSSCGSCWSFSTVAFFQSDLIINNNFTKQLDLSQQFLLQCDNKSLACDGGFLFTAMDKVIQDVGGLPLDIKFPYNQLNDVITNMCFDQNALISVPSTRKLVYYFNVQDQTFIQKIILKKPVNINICSPDFQFYAPTNQSRTLKCSPNNKVRDHTILLIGYTETQWIVKNQWGENWGINGYGYISRNADNDCCIGKQLYTTGVVSSTQTCKVQNCEVCIQQTSCHKCKPGYYVTNGQSTHTCAPCKAQNCQQCINYYGLCSQCKKGYSVMYPSYRCRPWIIQNCNFMYEGYCQECFPGYLLNQDSTGCIDQKLVCRALFCEVCQENNLNLCKKCMDGYAFNSQSKQCVQVKQQPCIIENCFMCNKANSSICQLCDDNYMLDKSATKCVPFCSVDQCTQCAAQSSSICKTCATNYVLSTDRAACQKCNVPFCQECGYTTSQCKSCYVNFFLNSTSLKCQSCRSRISYCISCKQNTDNTNLSCFECAPGYTPNEDKTKCIKCLSECADCSYNSLQSCSTSCRKGYYTQAKTLSCKLCKQGCIDCSSYESCNKCSENYILNDNKICTPKCDDIQKCSSCLNSTYCARCYDGYVIKQGKCVFNANYECLQENNNNTANCIFCPQRYYWDVKAGLNICKKCNVTDTNCIRCKFLQNNACSQCSKGYYLAENISKSNISCILCSATLPYCIQCPNDSFCTKCQPGYYLISTVQNTNNQASGICTKCSDNCLTCQFNAQFCTSCRKGYILSSTYSCTSNTAISFTLVLGGNFQTINISNLIMKLIQQLTKILKLDSQRYINIQRIVSGSIQVYGDIQVPQIYLSKESEFHDTAAKLISSESSLVQLPLLSVKTEIIKIQETTNQDNGSGNNNSTNDNTNTNDNTFISTPSTNSGLSRDKIIGISVGGGVFFIIILISTIYAISRFRNKYKSNLKRQKNQQNKNKKNNSHSKSTQIKGNQQSGKNFSNTNYNTDISKNQPILKDQIQQQL